MPFTTATGNKILNKLLRATDFTHPTSLRVSLHTDAPGEDGSNELEGTIDYPYERQAVTFDEPQDKETSNMGRIEWYNLPEATISHIGLWDTNDPSPNFWWGAALEVARSIDDGDGFVIEVSDLTAELDA